MTTVLQIIPSLGVGGAEQACVDVTAGLKAAGHRAIVISSGGIRVEDIERAGGWHIKREVQSKNPATMLANSNWLTEFIREQKIDIVHARSRAPAWSALCASRRTSTAFVTTFHAAYKFSGALKKFYNSVMARGDRVIAISDFIADHIRKTYPSANNKIRTIPRGINMERFWPDTITPERRERLRQTWEIENHRPIILMPSRISPIKGQKILIEAMSLMPAAMDAVAVIVGDDQGRDNYRQQLENMVGAGGLQDRVKFISICDDIPAAYSLASLTVAPSLVPEGFGRTPVESMAMGIPIIASDLGGYRETVKHGETGWLVTPGDPQKLADAIIEALNQPEAERAAMLQKAKYEARMRYDKYKMVADTLAVYNELMK